MSDPAKHVLPQLARIHSARFARHPLFLVGALGATAVAAWAYTVASHVRVVQLYLLPGFATFLGLFGLIAAYRLTRTEERALALLPSAPTSASARTLALCCACVVPAAMAALCFLVLIASWAFNPQAPFPGEAAWSIVMPATSRAAWVFGGTVVAALGGSLLGVTVARWFKFPGAAVIVAVALWGIGLTALVVAGTGTAGDIVANLSPFTGWLEWDAGGGVVGARSGSQFGHVVYQLALSALAVWAATTKSVETGEKSRWRVLGWSGLALAVIGQTWTFVG